jgi:ribonuclease-3
MIIDRSTVETLVGTKISNIDLYQKAFRHKSALKEDETLDGSFETLEFIGDSVLGFVITKFLFDRYENKQEGFLTKARTKLVRGETLANIATKLELYKWVQMDEKGMRNEWNKNPKILEDVFESLVGAIYMDLGLLHAKQFILNIYNNPNYVNMNCIMVDDNFKDHLMRYCQTNNLNLPDYRVISHENGIFYIDVYVDSTFLGRGWAKNKKQAEQYAARSFFYPPHLNYLNNKNANYLK